MLSLGRWMAAAHSELLRRKIASLGELKGKTKRELIDAAGPPQVEVVADNGRQVLTWVSPEYSISVTFDDDDVVVS